MVHFLAQFLHLVVSLSAFILHVQAQGQRILPTQYDFPTLLIMAVNGSSKTGQCANVSIPNLDTTTTCNDPDSSALFDGHIPTLTELDGSTWADQMMVLGFSPYGYSSTRIDAYIPYTTVGRVEVTLFNCPQWRIGAHSITVRYSTSTVRSAGYRSVVTVNPTVFSCDSLVTVCIPISRTARMMRVNFNRYNYLYVAEIAFYANSLPCPAFTITPGNWTVPDATETITSSSEESATTDDPQLSLGGLSAGLQKEFRPFLSVLSVFAAVQTTLIVAVGAVMVCKYRRKKKVCPEEEELVQQQQPAIAGKEEEEEEDEVYEIVDDKPAKPPRPPNRPKKIHYIKNNAYS